MERKVPSISRFCLAVAILSAGFLGQLGCTASDSKRGLQADRIVIIKSEHRMDLIRDGHTLKEYKVALGRSGGRKLVEGDHKTPEGLYVVDSKISESRFYKALHLNYPHASDLERARKLGVNPGSAIEIHGIPWWFGRLGPVQHRIEWTDGCIAVSNSQIEEIWKMVPVGTPVEIRL